jgi:polysaccharide export outer membrane protein
MHTAADGGAALKIAIGDILSVTVSSLNPDEDAVFNAPANNNINPGAGYQVGSDGFIRLHRLGLIKAEGVTRKELKEKLEKELTPFLKDPVITVQFLNHRITVLGEMGAAKVINMPAEKISLFEALGEAGSTFTNTQLNDVVVIREQADTKQVKHINLEDHSIFASPWYYLQPNDVVVLVPDKERVTQDQQRLQNQQIATFVLQGVSLAVLVYANFLRR